MAVDVFAEVSEAARAAKKATRKLREASSEVRFKALDAVADILRDNVGTIIEENQKDLENAHRQKLSSAMKDRLELNEKRIADMIAGVASIRDQEDIVGSVDSQQQRADGLSIVRQRIPIGVIGMIFESRPNVVVDCAALAIRSGNAILLKGGKEARYSNHCLGQLIRQAMTAFLPKESVVVLESTDRGAAVALMHQTGLIDLLIPRGGENLIRFVADNAKVPFVAHDKGLCHIFVDRDANLETAMSIVNNAKAQRPGVCNALETLLVDQVIARDFLQLLLPTLEASAVEVRGCARCQEMFPNISLASDDDWDAEYLDLILSIKVVDDIAAAIDHIENHGSQHTEGICSENPETIKRFKNAVDASCITVNASTRFNDGGELGLGAEIGISTSKLHAYGPMGARELTTIRYVLAGSGHIRT
ncbi:MAG: glutamate-5-semialdehyde dehydrogenase [Pseudobacteriovorax sp.]|nr:glutamate-5-semialdehyde dehydrogenase [Pseudobacteriovorax sp.]